MKPKASPGLLTPQKPVKENRRVTQRSTGVTDVCDTFVGVTCDKVGRSDWGRICVLGDVTEDLASIKGKS